MNVDPFKSLIVAFLLVHLNPLSAQQLTFDLGSEAKVHKLFTDGLKTILREPHQGFIIAQEIRKASEEIRYEEGKLLAGSLKAFTYFQHNKLDTCMLMLVDVIPKLEKSFPESFFLGIAKNYQGRTLSRLNSLSKAGIRFQEAASTFLKLDSISYYCMALNNVGTIQGMQGHHADALASFLEVVKTSSEQKVASNFKSSALSNIAYIHQLEHHYHKALEYAYMGLKVDLEIDNPRAIAESYSLLGTIYLENNELDSAMHFYQKVATVGSQNDTRLQSIRSRALSNISKIYAARGDIRRAVEHLEKEVDKKTGDEKYLLEVMHLQLAEYYSELNDTQKAIQHGKQSLNIALAQNIKLSVRDAAKSLSSIYLQNSDYKSAYKYFEMYHSYDDSIYNASAEKKFSNLRIELETLEKEKEIEALKNQRAVDISNQRLLLGGILALMLITSIGIWAYRKSNILKEKKLLNEIESKKSQLTNHTLNMLHKNNGFSEIENEIVKMRKSGELNYRKILNIINRNRAEERDWDNFRNYFGQVHKDFERRINTKFPHLSVGDFRLATLVKLNLTNSEIASLLFIESKSVRMSKYRLKKKLGLGEEDNLIQYLNSI